MDVFCGQIINIGDLKISETPDFGVKAGFEIFLAETSASITKYLIHSFIRLIKYFHWL